MNEQGVRLPGEAKTTAQCCPAHLLPELRSVDELDIRSLRGNGDKSRQSGPKLLIGAITWRTLAMDLFTRSAITEG